MSLLKTLKGQILVLSALCMVAALLVLTLVNYFSARGQAQVSLAEEGLATAKSHAETIEEWARGKSAIIAASVTAFEEPEPAKPLAMLRDAGKFSTAYFGYADKKYVFSETRNLPADYDPTARPWYKQAAQAGTSVVTPPYISASDQKLVVTFATPVGAGAALKGVAAGDVYMESVVANVASIRPTPQSFGFLVSADGKIIAHRDQALTLKPIAELSKDLAVDKLVAAAKDSTSLLQADIGGRNRLLSVVPIAGTSWMLVVALDESEAMAPIRAMLATSLVSSVLVLLVAVGLLGVILTRRLRQLSLVHDAGTTMKDIVTSVQRVTDIMAEITASTNEQSTSINEVGQAVSHLDQMTQQNAALVEQSAAAAQSLKDQSVRLSEVVGTFRLSADASRAGPRLSTPAG